MPLNDAITLRHNAVILSPAKDLLFLRLGVGPQKTTSSRAKRNEVKRSRGTCGYNRQLHHTPRSKEAS
jgi:hypothetical protein